MLHLSFCSRSCSTLVQMSGMHPKGRSSTPSLPSFAKMVSGTFSTTTQLSPSTSAALILIFFSLAMLTLHSLNHLHIIISTTLGVNCFYTHLRIALSLCHGIPKSAFIASACVVGTSTLKPCCNSSKMRSLCSMGQAFTSLPS